MSKFKLGVSLVLVFLVIIIVLQNTEPVETRILFATVIMSRAVLLFTATLIGFFLGVLFSLAFSRKMKTEGGR